MIGQFKQGYLHRPIKILHFLTPMRIQKCLTTSKYFSFFNNEPSVTRYSFHGKKGLADYSTFNCIDTAYTDLTTAVQDIVNEIEIFIYYTSMIFILRSPNLLFIILQTTRIFFLQIKI